jgi:hypothetical protein
VAVQLFRECSVQRRKLIREVMCECLSSHGANDAVLFRRKEEPVAAICRPVHLGSTSLTVCSSTWQQTGFGQVWRFVRSGVWGLWV